MRNAQAHNTQPEAFETRLRAYAAGAGAIATGLLAFSPPAAAEIVVVPAHVYLYNSFPIEIEGTTAVTLTNRFFDSSTFGYCVSLKLSATAASGAGVVGHGRSNQPAPLKFGAAIGPADQFGAGKQLLADGISCRDFGWGVGGPFANTTNRFLGLKFELNGQVYYGWAGFGVVFVPNGTVEPTAFLKAYAYETEPNTPIYAGQSSDSPREARVLPATSRRPNDRAAMQPATLGLLALGSLGLDVWRKRDAPEADAPQL